MTADAAMDHASAMRARRPRHAATRRTLRRAGTLLAVVLLALGVRNFVAVPRSVPSGSMMPALLPGDVFLAARWPYGSALAARLGGRAPRRGEIVVVRTAHGDVVKRVIGLPGDRVALVAGAVWLNGRALPRFRVADALVPVAHSAPCAAVVASAGVRACRIARWRELPPDATGRWDTLDRGRTAADRMAPAIVPRGRLFLLGDDRDASGDSRFAAEAGGLGMVDAHRLAGRALVILWSRDATARATGLSRWWRSVRRERIGRLLTSR